MSRVVRLPLVTLLLPVVVGCSPDLFANFFPRSALATQLLAVVADPASFPPADHPLRDVANGAIIDDLAGLTGFWGTTRTSVSEDPDTGELTTLFEVSKVLEIDVNAGTMKTHQISRCVAQDGCTLVAQDAELVVVSELEIRILASNRCAQKFLPGGTTASSFNSNGDVDFNILPLSVVDPIVGVPSETLFTLQGNFLKTLEGSIGATPEDVIASGFEEEATTLWVRIAP